MAKYKQISELLEKRISHGDYYNQELPTENRMATEIGVSRMTARKAIMHLIERGILKRKDNGRIVVCDKLKSAETKIAFLAPSWPSSELQIWRNSLEKEVARQGVSLRPIDYVHDDDPAIIEAIDNFDGIFMLPGAQTFAGKLVERMSNCPKIVILGHDYSWAGIVSINPFPASHIRRLLDVYKTKGVKRVECVCGQPLNSSTELRIREWNLWRKLNRMDGDLITTDLKPSTYAVHNSYKLTVDYLKRNQRKPEALFCCSITGAIGTSRACKDAGLVVGKDVLITAVNGEEMNRYLQPSITSLENKDVQDYISLAIEWMKQGAVEWDGSILLEPDSPQLFLGESTGDNGVVVS